MLKKNAWILALIAALVLGLAACGDGGGGAGGGGGVVFNVSTFTGLTVGSDGINNYGIGNSNATLVIESGALKVTAKGGYAGAKLAVGTALSGSNDFRGDASKAFTPEVGKTHKITIKASAPAAGGATQFRTKCNNSDSTPSTPNWFNLTATPTDFVHTFVYASHDIIIDTPTSGTAFIIHSIKIEQLN